MSLDKFNRGNYIEEEEEDAFHQKTNKNIEQSKIDIRKSKAQLRSSKVSLDS